MRTFKFFAFALTLALMLVTAASAVQGPIVHRVSVGGPDSFGPGGDANFSLSAREYADGSVSGQYTDRFAQAIGGGGFHAVIDCLSISDDGNEAWVGGVITKGTFPDFPEPGDVFDLTGVRVVTRVRDNGTSAKDPPDQISLSVFFIDGDPTPCTDQPTESPFFDLFDVPQGQVKVR